jgi:hypothetical protein
MVTKVPVGRLNVHLFAIDQELGPTFDRHPHRPKVAPDVHAIGADPQVSPVCEGETLGTAGEGNLPMV